MPTKKQNAKSVNKIKTRRRPVNVRRKCQHGGALKDLWMKMRMEKWLIRNNRVVPLTMTNVDNPLYGIQTTTLPTQRNAFPPADECQPVDDILPELWPDVFKHMSSKDIQNLAITSKNFNTLVKGAFVSVQLTQTIEYGHKAILLNIAAILNRVKTNTRVILGDFKFDFVIIDDARTIIKLSLMDENKMIQYKIYEYNVSEIYNFLLTHLANNIFNNVQLGDFCDQANIARYINDTDKKEIKDIYYTRIELSEQQSTITSVKNDISLKKCEKYKSIRVPIPISLYDALMTLKINKSSYDHLISLLYYIDNHDKDDDFSMATHFFKQLIRLKHKENVNNALDLKCIEADYEKMATHLSEKIKVSNDETTTGTIQLEISKIEDVKQMRFCILHICDTIYSYINDKQRKNDAVLNYMIILSRFFNYALTNTDANDPLSELIKGLHTLKKNDTNAVLIFMAKYKDALYSHIIGNAYKPFWKQIIDIGDAITAAVNNQVLDIQTQDPYTYTPKQFIEGIHVDLVDDTPFEDYDRIKNWGDIFIYMNDEYINNAMKTIKFETKANNLLNVTYDGVEEHLNINSTKFNEFIDSAIKFDPATMHILFPNFCPKPPQPGGGKKPTAYKKTDMRYEYNGRNRIVYVGKRGGKYIQIKNKMIPVSKLN